MNLYQEALQQFHQVFAAAQQLGLDYPQALSLATASADGRPAVRTVLLKGVDEAGFVFYTNQTSRKGRELANNPHAALLFYWQGLHRQVHIEGRVETVTAAEADEYWQTRPLESRIGAWASQQSSVLASRDELEARYRQFAEQYGDHPPRPPHWSGYRVVPEVIEFWEERPFRLHERTRYFQTNEGEWRKELLNP